jgi:membrane peptidoglycan carboxypeptidase
VKIDYPRAGHDGWRRFVPSWRQALAVCGGGVLLVILVFVIAYFTVSVPDPNKLAVAQTTSFLYADGKTAIGTDGAANRQSVQLKQVPTDVRYAVLAAEDRNFYSEPAVSFTGMGRALFVDVTGGDVQGGSTITQQYVKNAYLSQKRSVFRKLKEVVIAVKLSHQQSKDEILADYLNTIYFGRGAYGIQTAAQTYFGRDVSQLNVSQAALLAAVVRAPAFYDPTEHPDKAKVRWQYVLSGMVKKKWLTQQQAAEQHFPPAGLRTSRTASSLAGPKGYVIRSAEAELAAHGFTQEELDRGGLHVITTVQQRAQDAAVKAVDDVVPSDAPKDLRTALVAVEPGTGKVLAMYGGADYQKRQFNDATQGTAQPGSSFKPYVLVTALAHGIPLSQTYDGHSPQTIHGQKVKNFNDEQFGKIDLPTATAHSVNTVYYQLGFDAGGPSAVADTATKAGITTKLDPQAAGGSLFLGGGSSVDVHPIDQADGFATFAAQGVHAAPYLVSKVVDAAGHTLYTAKEKTDHVFDSDVMADTTAALQQVLREGTGTGARLSGGRPAAGKTGTTSGNTAAWFVGYTPQMSASVALFRDNNKPLQGILGRSEVTGGSVPASVWKAFMDAALAGQPIKQFPPAANIAGSPSPTPSGSPTPTATPTAKPTPSLPASLPPRPTSTPPPSRPPVPSVFPSRSPDGSGQPAPGTSP